MDEKKPLIIFDTDMDTDCDDAGALAMLYEYAKRGKADLLGIVSDSVSPYAAPCCEALGNFYGVGVPIGALDSDFCFGEERLVRYREHSKEMSFYNKEIASSLQKTCKNYPSEVEVYRRCLADAPDGSVTVVCVGLLTALANTLMSTGDEISPLSGVELFRQKVKMVISMGTPEREKDFNWGMDAVAAETFFRLCPVSVVASQYGTEVVTGRTLRERLPEEHPLRRIYELYARGKEPGRSSWDLVALLYALEPDCGLFRVEEKGMLFYNTEEDKAVWNRSGSRRDYEVALIKSSHETAEYIEHRMTGKF